MLFSKIRDKKYFYKPPTADTPLPLQKIINFVCASGINFGPKSPQTKISYLQGLGLFEDLIDKTTKNTNLKRNSQSHLLPYSTVARIVQIETLHTNGLSYKKILKIYQNFKSSALLTTPKEAEANTTYKLNRQSRHPKVINLPNRLIATFEIIKIAAKLNIDLGRDPSQRIRYLIKLAILPQTVKKMSKRYRKIVGHLPDWSIDRLIYANKLHLRGLSYPKIAQKIKRVEKRHNQSTSSFPNGSFSLLQYHLNKKLQDHAKKIEQIVENKLDRYLEEHQQLLQSLKKHSD